MDFDYMKDFIKVVEYNSLNKASKELNISTPALSKRIKSIENYFDCDLFYRTSKGIFLTKSGNIVFHSFLKMNEQIKDLKNKISNSKNRKIRLGIIPSFSLYKLHERDYFTKRVVLVVENSTSVLIEELYKDNIDVIIGDITYLKNDSLYIEEIYTEDFIVAYADKNKFKNIKQVNVESLKKEKIYIQTPPCDTYNFLKNYSLKDKLHINYVDYYETILANVKANKCITLIPQSLTIRLESMNLYQKKLQNYKRIVGIVSLDKNKMNSIIDITQSMNNIYNSTTHNK
ncbi:LysR family transcriptional regulator [Staphylococcus epidermidis]|uniref:LysR family transcriptional regulator n=1 Tax=Staphylococcus epidermidis TaxID=1282 RepID=UPI001D0D6549|nr:LysR family transcriptional regulator [Staphylococcus epidermidis]MCC2072406.1 LysR family transcriptional regulator [Staphylococcus epidermidis]